MRITLTILALTLGLTRSFASPIGERRVIVDQERFELLDCAQQHDVLDTKSRLEVIIGTDRSDLSHDQRQALRTEYKELKRTMTELNRGGSVIYISTAGVIIIVLLLIILL